MTLLATRAECGVTFTRRGALLVPTRRLQGAELADAKADKDRLLADLLQQEPAVQARIEEMRRLGAVRADPTADAARWATAHGKCLWCLTVAAVAHGYGYCDTCWGAGYVLYTLHGETCVRHPERPVERFAPNGAPMCHECHSARQGAVQREQAAVAKYGPLFPEHEEATA